MEVDLICCWPRHLDYPLFRKFIHENRDKFKKIIIVLTNMNVADDLTSSLQEKMKQDRVTLLVNDPVKASADWRNVAMQKALSISTAQWVWFVEQDFFPLNNFFKEVIDLSKRVDVFGFYQDSRLHPCCIFIKRDLLDKTSKDFSAHPPEYDHFGKLQKDLERKGIITGVIFSNFGYHMNGLSQNLYLKMIGETPNYAPEKFAEYLKKAEEYENQNIS